AVLCFEAIGACIRKARMSFGGIVRINAYVCAREHMAPYMAVRDRYVALPAPASTLMIVGGFTRREFTVEIEAIAAKVDG
ncbi:MAG: Rid family hydrolase, partial [Xanthobacteraceae bacterium]